MDIRLTCWGVWLPGSVWWGACLPYLLEPCIEIWCTFLGFGGVLAIENI